MYYVYEWFIVETNEVFYVGKGCRNRYKVKKHNKLFSYILQNNNCDSRIIKEFYSEKEAFEYEYLRVNELKSIGQCQANIYKGGMGGTTNWWNDEVKEKYSRNNVMKNENQRKRMSINNPMKNENVKKIVVSKISKKVVLGDKVYNSLKELANEYNVRDNAIQYWLERGYGRNQEPCYYYGNKPKEIIIRTHETSNKAILIDGIYFKNIKTGAKSINVSSESIIRAIKNKRLCKGYKVEYANQQPSHENSK